jgi:protein involved in polysaccharide export with SLBB domain
MLKLPHIPGVPAQGRPATDVEAALAESLVSNGIFRTRPRISVRLADFSSAQVHVSGAVFEPGSVEIGRIAGDDQDRSRVEASGASTELRNLSVALRAAGGIRPDADLSRVTIRRGGETLIVDARPAIEGRAFADMMLSAGDEIEVPSRGCFQEALMAPTSVTPPGVKVFMSNLTQPASANALAAIGKDTRELRYGTRFIQAVVGMNCVGGAKLTNADRYAVLFSRNPVTGNSIVIERRLEELLRSADRDDLDPFILPGDAIACYDSTVTNITEVARSIAQVTAGAVTAGILLPL